MNYQLYTSKVTGVIHRIARFQGLGPLSPRSVIILLTLLYLLVGPINNSSDIVSAGLAYGGLTVIATLVSLVVIHGIILQRGTSVHVLPPEIHVVSQTSARIVLHLPELRILPLTHLDLLVDFEHPLPVPKVVRVTGMSRGTRRVHLDVTFPHRGSWLIRGVRCKLEDIAGLAHHSWHCAQETSVVVAPPMTSEAHLPILSSTQRPGDLVIDNVNRQGDPFEIKAYHPSDGVKKIVWKAFAKRGELLSRHPEASMTPEGYVVILVLAGPSDDEVCSRALAYVRSLDELKLDIVVGCQGGRGEIPASTPGAAETLLIDAVWESARDSQEELVADTTALLDYCHKTTLGIKVSKILIFCSGNRLSDQAEARKISEIAAWLDTQGIAPVFCLTPPPALRATNARQRASLAARWFMLQDTTDTNSNSPSAYHDFLSGCLHKQWEVFV
jgi:uncharacterized protein (DUF58 family)